MNEAKQTYDVVICGGGLAGLSLAIQLRNRLGPLDIAVIERTPHPVPESAHKVGESLVELSTHYFTNVLGLKAHLLKDQLPKLGLRFFFKDHGDQHKGAHRLNDCIEFGAKQFPHSPSFQLDRGIFENYLGQRCRELGVDFFDGCKVQSLDIKAKTESHRVDFIRADGQRQSVTCRWLVDACSRTSLLKKQQQLEAESEHKVSSAWFRIADKLDVNDFSNCQSWKGGHQGDNSRWFSTNHFMGQGYWVWFIPLSSGSTSIGIVADNRYHPLETYNSMDKAMQWLEQHEPLCAEQIRPHLDKQQDFRFLRNFSHSCEQVYSKDRWFLTGEAGVFLDPFYSPGSDFIAISNTFICNLIEADKGDSETFAKDCFILNLFYLNLFGNTSNIYQNQYELYGNPRVMPIKILWDFAVYWSFTAFLYIQGKFADTQALIKIRHQLEELGEMNQQIQAFFLDWHRQDQGQTQSQYIDPFDYPFLEELNQGLYTQLDEQAFESKFSENLANLRSIFNDISQAACKHNPQLQPPLFNSDSQSGASGLNALIDQLR